MKKLAISDLTKPFNFNQTGGIMRRKKLMTKVLPAIMAASMVMSLAPTTAFAVTGSQVAKDGSYTAEKTVDASDPVVAENEEAGEWESYDIRADIVVKDGKFESVTVTPGSGYDDGNDSYFKKATTKSKGVVFSICKTSQCFGN